MLPAHIATHVVMMIAAKNGVMKIATGVTTIANASIMIGQRDQGLENFINNVEQPHTKRNFNAAYEELLVGPCLIHKNSKHTMWQCHGMAKAFCNEEQK